MAAQEQPTPQQENTMQLAEILSDLVSLRVCDPAAALALVSARSHDTSTSSTAAASNTAAAATASQEEADVDLTRAKELVKLHYQVKEAHKKGQLGRGLDEARGMVARAVGS